MAGGRMAARGVGGGAGGGAGGGHGGHSVAFRVMRMARPGLAAGGGSGGARVDLGGDMGAEPSPAAEESGGEGGGAWAGRVQAEGPEAAAGIDGALVLPQSFGAIHLGETFRSYISLGNVSSHAVKNLSVRAELQTERQRKTLFDNSETPLESLRPGGRFDFAISHDLKELGAHTLICNVMYSEPDGERKYLAQYFKFASTNPLVVRMKVRSVGPDTTFLEACLESAAKGPLLIDSVRFETPPSCSASPVGQRPQPAPGSGSGPAGAGGRFDLGQYLENVDLLERAGQSKHFVFRLERRDRGGASDGIQTQQASSNQPTQNVLGKLEIRWRGQMGEPGRLQTQQILGPPLAARIAELQLLGPPPEIIRERPFPLTLTVQNRTARETGPLTVTLSGSLEASPVVMSGPCSVSVPPLPAGGARSISVLLIATRAGVQPLGDLTLTDPASGERLDTLSGVSLEVKTG